MATTKSDTGHSREIVGLKKIRESVFVCKDVNRGKKRAADRLCRVYVDQGNKKIKMDAYEEIVLIGDLTHPRITPIEEVRGNDEGIAVVYQSNAGNLKGKNWLIKTSDWTRL
jgi:hypothetical protein